MAELKSVKRLCPDSLVDELKMLRRIANQLVLGQGKYLSHEGPDRRLHAALQAARHP